MQLKGFLVPLVHQPERGQPLREGTDRSAVEVVQAPPVEDVGGTQLVGGLVEMGCVEGVDEQIHHHLFEHAGVRFDPHTLRLIVGLQDHVFAQQAPQHVG